MQAAEPNHYATLGLDYKCTPGQIRTAYRILAKQFHPDVNQHSMDALARTQQLNAAYEVLSDPDRRQEYDQSRIKPHGRANRTTKVERNISQDVHLRIDELLHGATLDVRVNDPANVAGVEVYELTVPPGTAPGARFRLPRGGTFEGGWVLMRVRVRPDFRFKPRGSDLRCDLRISAQRAAAGGFEMIQGTAGRLRVDIPRNVSRGEIIRIPNEGLPKPRGGRGDLLVKITYRPEVRISRAPRR